MVDFHTHILPNIDDGAKNIKETIDMLKEAKKMGFDELILTPHYYEAYYKSTKHENEIIVKEISNKLTELGINIKLYLGNEVYITNEMVELLNSGIIASINNSKFVLFELSFSNWPMNIYDIIYNMLENGQILVLAHPERYEFLIRNPEKLDDLIEKGVLIQCEYASILGYYGGSAKKFVKKLLKEDKVHFLGSDVHKPNTIYPLIPKALKKIEKIIGKEKLKDLTTNNARLVLENKDVI